MIGDGIHFWMGFFAGMFFILLMAMVTDFVQKVISLASMSFYEWYLDRRAEMWAKKHGKMTREVLRLMKMIREDDGQNY